jgi:hypothetical protein
MPGDTKVNREQTHDLMRAAASTPVTGPAANDALAAIGGIDVPGHEPHPLVVQDDPVMHEPIPGERDASTLTHREAGAIGRSPADDLPLMDPHALLDEQDIDELQREGGGARRERKNRP